MWNIFDIQKSDRSKRTELQKSKIKNQKSKIKNQKFYIDGSNLEKWILKALCGLIASKNATSDLQRKLDFNIPLLWKEILIDDEVLPEKWGLYLDVVENDTISTGDKFGIAPITDPDTDNIIGCRFEYCGFPFMLLLRTFEK